MSATKRRTTRSSSRALSDTSEPVDNTNSLQSARSERRRTRKSDKSANSIPKETYSYGTDVPGTHSQQLAAQAAMMKPVLGIETGVEQAARDAVRGYARDLSVIAEEARPGGGFAERHQVGGNLRGNTGDRSDSELTGMKTFGREYEDSLYAHSRRQSRAPSIEQELYDQFAHDRSIRDSARDSARGSAQSSTWGSTWDSIRGSTWAPTWAPIWGSIRGSIPGIFKYAGWLLLILPIVATAISLYFTARWYPIMKDLQLSGYSCSSFDASECSRLATIEVERFGRRLDGLEDQFRKLPRTSETAARSITRQVNWLSYDLGARAIPHLSTPNEYFQKEATKAKPIENLVKPRWWKFWRGRSESSEVVNGELNTLIKFEKIDYGPNSALQPWRENEPRYCTPGKLQLAVKLPRPVTPVNLFIEYYLKDEILAVGAAPKDVELWIPVPDDDTRAAVVRLVTDYYPDILAEERAETGRFLGQRQALASHWIPVGRWTYDIYANEVSQKFRVYADLESLGVSVDEIVIRVNSNWANRDVTCLVRARMNGIDRSGVHEQLDAPPDGKGRSSIHI